MARTRCPKCGKFTHNNSLSFFVHVCTKRRDSKGRFTNERVLNIYLGARAHIHLQQIFKDYLNHHNVDYGQNTP